MPFSGKELWISAFASSWLLVTAGLFVVFNRRIAVAREAKLGRVIVQWRAPVVFWREYLVSKLAVYANTVIVWIAFYSLAMSLFQGEGPFLDRFLGFAGYSLIMVGPALLVFGLIAYFLPPSYYLMTTGVGVSSWIPIILRSGTGFLNQGCIPRARIENYRWEGDLTVIKSKKTLFSQGVTELLVASEVRDQIDDFMKELQIPKGEPLGYVRKGKGKDKGKDKAKGDKRKRKKR